MTGLYIKAAVALAAVVALCGLFIGGMHYERSRADAATAKARVDEILKTEGLRDDAANLDDDGLVNTLGRWILPSP